MESNSIVTSRWRYSSNTASLRTIRDDLRVFLLTLNGTDLDVDKVIIAVNEACMNIVQHANNGQYTGDINVSCDFDDQTLLINISDDAEFADINKLRPVNNNLLKPGGHGLHIIDKIMDSMVFSHKEGACGNILTMMKYL